MIHHIDPLQQLVQTKTINKPKKNETKKFKEIFQNVNQVHISKHAKQRLVERNIHIDEQQWQKIHSKMNEAKQKGVTDSLVIMNNAALLVSTKNNTVVTAMSRDEADTKIFTNINGTILINE